MSNNTTSSFGHFLDGMNERLKLENFIQDEVAKCNGDTASIVYISLQRLQMGHSQLSVISDLLKFSSDCFNKFQIALSLMPPGSADLFLKTCQEKGLF